jgi:hypothetical protein
VTQIQRQNRQARRDFVFYLLFKVKLKIPLIGDKGFIVEGPGVVNIPANTPHTFVNISDKPVQVVTFFPSASYKTNWKVLGPNPWLTKAV